MDGCVQDRPVEAGVEFPLVVQAKDGREASDDDDNADGDDDDDGAALLLLLIASACALLFVVVVVVVGRVVFHVLGEG